MNKLQGGAQILFLDIETAPSVVYTWGLFNQNIAINQIVEPGYVLCWSAKFLGDEKVHFGSVQQRKPLRMLGKLHDLLEKADIVVGYNSTSFDLKHINREFLMHGFAPPSPYKQVDLLKTARSQFKFQSNKLQFLLTSLNIGEKAETGGFSLWRQVMANNKEAWKKMRHYNETDVAQTEALYLKLMPWVKGHVNVALYSPEKEQCPTCGSEEFQQRGYYRGQSYTYKKYSCNKCRKWFRGNKSDGGRQAKYTGIS